MRLSAYFGKRLHGYVSCTHVHVNTRTSTVQRLLQAGSHRSVCRPRPHAATVTVTDTFLNSLVVLIIAMIDKPVPQTDPRDALRHACQRHKLAIVSVQRS